MRKWTLALPALLLAATLLRAQSLDPKDPLDSVLMRWEKAMKEVNTLSAQLVRTTLDRAFQSTEVYEGIAKYMKPNLASLYMVKKNRPEAYEKYICTGNYLYMYAPAEKKIRVAEVPHPKQGQLADDNFLSFLFGMKAEEAKKRYEMTLLQAPANDKWYYYIMIRPQTTADKKDFTKARLVLSNTTFLPRQLWFEQPNHREITWDFPRLVNGAALQRSEFAMPQLPQGWVFEKFQPQNKVPPRVVRPNR
jgi:TIGR03009 family protein